MSPLSVVRGPLEKRGWGNFGFWILDFGLPSRLRRLLVAFGLLPSAHCLLLTAYLGEEMPRIEIETQQPCFPVSNFQFLISTFQFPGSSFQLHFLPAARAARVEPMVISRDSLGMLVTKGVISQPNPVGMSRVREIDSHST